MSTFVIVHGGWGGGWEWAPVARGLRARGHEVHTPTLTGLGERAHRGSPSTSLSDHVEDVLAVLRYEQLHDVVLCGHSYGGMVATGVADRAAERVALLVYLDGFAPVDGQALVDLAPPDAAEGIRAAAAEREDGLLPCMSDLLPAEGTLPEDVRRAYVERLVAHPVRTMIEPLRVSGAVEHLPRAYVRCTGYEHSPVERSAERARREGWTWRELSTEHDLQLFDPGGTVAVLDDLAASTRGPLS